MRNRKNDIERYLRGELSAAERHALEKEALNDPFLAEALEGLEHTGADNFLYDLHQLHKSVHHRTRSRKNKPIKMWGWTVGIAASVLLVAVSGFLVISLLKDQRRSELAMKEQPEPAKAVPETDSVATTLDDDVNEPPPSRQEPLVPTRHEAARAPVKPGQPSATEKNEVVQQENKPLAEESSQQNEALSQLNNIEREAEETAAAEVPEATRQVKEKDNAVTARDADEEAARRLDGQAAGVETKKQSAAPSQAPMPATRLLTGRVVSATDGEALPGVNVMIKGTNSGTVTNAQGDYQLSLPDGKSSLVFAFIGFENAEVEAGGKNQVNVQLAEDATQLSEVVVTGYGLADKTETHATTFLFAEPDGGKSRFKNYLSTQIKYPEAALRNKTEGRVTIRFTVEPNGNLADFEVIKGIGYGCDEELIRLVKEGPAWKPSTRGGQPLRDQVKVRFKFELP